MSRVFSWFFIFYFFLGSLFPRTDFAQFWHTASAVEHFKLHQAEAIDRGDRFTLAMFIYEHYVDPDSHTHSDDSAHEDLPNQHFHAPLNFAIQSTPIFQVDILTSPIERVIGFCPTYYSFLFGEALDRPPSLS